MAPPPLPYSNLFSEIRIGDRTLHNRICLTATLTNYGESNRVTDRWIDFLVERDRGGAALLVSKVIAVDPHALAQAAIVTGFDDANMDGFRQSADGVAAARAPLLGQLWHATRSPRAWGPVHHPYQGAARQSLRRPHPERRIGFKKAKVAVARKLAIIRHRMWRDETDFQWSTSEVTA